MIKIKLRDMAYLQSMKYRNRKKTWKGHVFNHRGRLGTAREDPYGDDSSEEETEIEEE